jgi:hypothetical protein
MPDTNHVVFVVDDEPVIAQMRMPFAPALTERPRFFHVQNPATRVAVGICRAISSTFPKL